MAWRYQKDKKGVFYYELPPKNVTITTKDFLTEEIS